MFDIFLKLFASFSFMLLPALFTADAVHGDKIPKWVDKFLVVCSVGWSVSVLGMIWSA